MVLEAGVWIPIAALDSAPLRLLVWLDSILMAGNSTGGLLVASISKVALAGR